MLNSRQLLIASATLEVRLKSDILSFVLSRKRLKSMKWIKSYFILKMEINKEKIRYILQYHYDKARMLHRLVKKFALFTVKILYQNQQQEMIRSLSCWKFRCEI